MRSRSPSIAKNGGKSGNGTKDAVGGKQSSFSSTHQGRVSAVEGLGGEGALLRHFTHPEPLSTMPWEMPVEERRKHSRDPRVMHQVACIERWNNTPLEVLWRRLLQFASHKKDFVMGPEDFRAWIAAEGVTSPHLQARLLEVFDPEGSQSLNALVVCKYLELALTTYPYEDLFVQHCFEMFDRPAYSTRLSKAQLTATVLAPPGKGKKGGGARKKSSSAAGTPSSGQTPRPGTSSSASRGATPQRSSSRRGPRGPLRMANGATYAMLAPLQAMLQRGEFAFHPSSTSLSPSPPPAASAASAGGAAKNAAGSPATHVLRGAMSVLSSSGTAGGGPSTREPSASNRGEARNPPEPLLPALAPQSPSSPRDAATPRPPKKVAEGLAPHYVPPAMLTVVRHYDSHDTPVQPDDITFDMFKTAFTAARNAEWVAAFAVPILECAAKYFAAPHGELPLISMRWRKTIEPVPASTTMFDADTALLREIEDKGFDPWPAPKKKKKSKKG